MPINYTPAAKGNRMSAVRTDIGNNGKLKFFIGGTATGPGGIMTGGTLVATAALASTVGTGTQTPANEAAFTGLPVVIDGEAVTLRLRGATGTNVANSFTTGTVSGSANPSTITYAEVHTSADVAVIRNLTVGTSTGDVRLDNTSVNNGQTITITSALISHAT